MARPPRSSDPAPATRASARSSAAKGRGKRRAKGDPPSKQRSRRARPRRASAPQPLEHRLLVTAILCLLAGGAVMVYSASSARTLLENGGDGTSYLVKYLTYGALGLVAMQVISRHGLAHARRYTRVILFAAFVMLLLVHVPGIGVSVNGARRWMGAGPLVFQPSEVMKLALVLHCAAVLSERPHLARSLRGVGGPILGVG